MRPGSLHQASLFPADSYGLAGIRSGMGDAGPLKETNKSSQVLERDLRGCHLESVSGENKYAQGLSPLPPSTSWVSDTGP